jgi:hypothetical protein
MPKVSATRAHSGTWGEAQAPYDPGTRSYRLLDLAFDEALRSTDLRDARFAGFR